MPIIDSHNWAGNNDSGWVNRTETGAVFVFGGRKFFVPTADQAYKCGHYRQEPIRQHYLEKRFVTSHIIPSKSIRGNK